jgi:CHAT domain-containing protein
VLQDLSTGKLLTPQESEAYLNIAFSKWALEPTSWSPEKIRLLANLASALQENHYDSWLHDFLDAPFSGKANLSLTSAIQANHSGDWDRAVVDAKIAEKLYTRSGNVAGAARSQVEAIYAYRRHSRANECVNELSALKLRMQQRAYSSFRILADFESSVCQSMLGEFDAGWRLAQQTISEAHASRYSSLELRALSLLSSMDSAEGRFRGAFQGDADGLQLFWQGLYAPERGFQFYSDAALTAEQAEFWSLAAVLQREALAMLEDTDRFDFQALARYHLGISAYRAGEISVAQEQFKEATALLTKMPDGSSRDFIEASSEIELALLDVAEQKLTSAKARLDDAGSAIEGTDSFLVKLLYFNTRAGVERLRHRPEEEWQYLQKTMEVARQGFASLNSRDSRWEWYREVDGASHRLIQMELEVKENPIQALADWEDYRAAEISPFNLRPGNAQSRARLLSRIAKMRAGTFISFIVLPEKVNIWVADQNGIRAFPINIDSETLKKEAQVFLNLCSDRNSSLEKVKQAGFRLYQRLIKPIEFEITSDRYLVIEADGFLSHIPWAALVTTNGEYLGQRYMFVNTPGLFFDHAGAPSQELFQNTVVVYPGAVEYEDKQYPPLPYAKAEADFVAGVHSGAAYLREEQATANQILRLLSRASLFHFAGHAVSREHGGELLLPGNEVVSSSAIHRLDLHRMQLVVLSACSTAEINSDISRNPNGLVQAFLAAGAQSAIATRWDVDSQATSEFMRELYASLHYGKSLASSIKTARQHTQKYYKHPYYWSSVEGFATPDAFSRN